MKEKLKGYELMMAHFEVQSVAADKLGVTTRTIVNWKKHGIPRYRRALVVSVLADMGVTIKKEDLKNG